jgi:hypothetical protein
VHRLNTDTFAIETTALVKTGLVTALTPLPPGITPITIPQQANGSTQPETSSAHDPICRVTWLLRRNATGRTLRDNNDALGLRAFADMLAGPPTHLSHCVASEPVNLDSLTQSTVVILTTNAAAEGLVTRSDILEYVAQGGALLLINDMTGNDERAPNRWFAPAGLFFDPYKPLTGRVNATLDHPVTRHWTGLAMNGCALKVDNPNAAVATTETGEVGLAALEHGQGRIVAMAAPGPLQSGALNRAFVRDALAWLRDSHQVVPDDDSDDDGLPDTIEDTNGDGKVDPNETDPTKRDTDGDGIPDPADPEPLTPQL